MSARRGAYGMSLLSSNSSLELVFSIAPNTTAGVSSAALADTVVSNQAALVTAAAETSGAEVLSVETAEAETLGECATQCVTEDPECGQCANGKSCSADDQCLSGSCMSGACASATSAASLGAAVSWLLIVTLCAVSFLATML